MLNLEFKSKDYTKNNIKAWTNYMKGNKLRNTKN